MDNIINGTVVQFCIKYDYNILSIGDLLQMHVILLAISVNPSINRNYSTFTCVRLYFTILNIIFGYYLAFSHKL